MKLLTKDTARRFPAIHPTDLLPAEQRMVIVRWFAPDSEGTWYAFEADALTDAEHETWEPLAEVVKARKSYQDVKFFGYVTGLGQDELGYSFSASFSRLPASTACASSATSTPSRSRWPNSRSRPLSEGLDARVRQERRAPGRRQGWWRGQ